MSAQVCKLASLGLVCMLIAGACSRSRIEHDPQRSAIPVERVQVFSYYDGRGGDLPIGLDVFRDGGSGRWNVLVHGYLPVAKFDGHRAPRASPQQVISNMKSAAARAGADTLLVVFADAESTGHAFVKVEGQQRLPAETLFAKLEQCKQAGFEPIASYETELENLERPEFNVERGGCLCFEWALDDSAEWSGLAFHHAAESIGNPPDPAVGGNAARKHSSEVRAHDIALRCSDHAATFAFGFGVNRSDLKPPYRWGQGPLLVRVFRKQLSEEALVLELEARRQRARELENAMEERQREHEEICARCESVLGICGEETVSETVSAAGVRYRETIPVNPHRCGPYIECLERQGIYEPGYC